MRRPMFLLLTCLLAVGLLASGCGLMPGSGGSGSESDTTPSEPEVPDNLPALTDGVVRVVLSWDEPVDMDLEVWDEDGQTAITSAGLENEDITDGTQGAEYVDLTGEIGEGVYVISVYFAEETNKVDSAKATLTIYAADGSTSTRSREIEWEEGRDQWHAFSVDATTGAIEDIDEIIETQVNE